MHPVIREMDVVVTDAAKVLRARGATQVFIFGSFVRGNVRPDSAIDIAVAGLSPRIYFSAASKVSDIFGRPVDLLDLDDDTPIVRYLLNSGDLVRVG
jgi:predicted nucleotidyltransferase